MLRPKPTLIAAAMQLVVMRVAHRNRKLIRDFHRHGTRLRKPQVVRLRRPPPADQTRLAGDKSKMRRISDPLLFWNEIRARRLRAGRSWGIWSAIRRVRLRLADLARAVLQGLCEFSC